MILALLLRLPLVCALIVAAVFCMRWGVEGGSAAFGVSSFRGDVRLGVGIFGTMLCMALAIVLLVYFAPKDRVAVPCRWVGGVEDNHNGL